MDDGFCAPTPAGPERMRRFREDGFFVTGPILSDAECDEIAAEYDRIGRVMPVGDAADGPLAYQPMLHLRSPLLTRYAADRRFIEIAAPLVGGDLRLYWEQAVTKPPHAQTEVPWHQDTGYGPTDPAEYVTCWTALEDATLNNGCLWVRPRSHRAGEAKHQRISDRTFLLSGYDGDERGVAAPIPRGAALVISSLLMHRSGPNLTDVSRRAWVLQYCAAATVHGTTRVPFDDRLLIARDGVPLDPPIRERPFDPRRS
ncbi:MAG TPA: phytanoyl-CoA dioxygenase family protein [Candidatus Acidoferrales bacterium]|nr:phytanoyl-CoA dioxygenase family protein [Candidatus Acidoferrales bacterium]